MKTSPLIKYLSFQLYTAILLMPRISKKSDPELLHKFRVAIRKTRSLIKLYMPEEYAFSDLLKHIVQETNELRELDVFLLENELSHYPLLQEEIKKYRKTLFEKQFTKKRVKATGKTLDVLYEDIVKTESSLEAERLISKAEASYKHCMQNYRAIDKETTEKQLHQLRIDFKVARYALEFLTESGLKNKKKKINTCKKTQERLGRVQDSANQIVWVKHFCKEHPLKECKRFTNLLKSRLVSLKQQLLSHR